MKSIPCLFGLVFVLGCPNGLPVPPGNQTAIEINATVVIPNLEQITITNAFFSISEIELISDVDIEGQKVKAEQIISSQANVVFSLPDAPPALYSRLRIKLNKPKQNTALPPEFQGEELSLLIEGFAQIAGGQQVPFRIQEDKQLKDLNLVLSQGIDLLPGVTAQISLRGDASQAFLGVAFDEIQPADLTNGVFLLDLRDQSFLNSHPAAEELAEEISENIELVFEVVINE